MSLAVTFLPTAALFSRNWPAAVAGAVLLLVVVALLVWLGRLLDEQRR